MEDLRIVELLLWFAIVMALVGWVFMLDYRKQNKFLLLKQEGYKNALLGYMMYRYKDLAKIEKLTRIHNLFTPARFVQHVYNVSGKQIDREAAQKYLDLFGEKLEDSCIEAVRNQIAQDFGKR